MGLPRDLLRASNTGNRFYRFTIDRLGFQSFRSTALRALRRPVLRKGESRFLILPREQTPTAGANGLWLWRIMSPQTAEIARMTTGMRS